MQVQLFAPLAQINAFTEKLKQSLKEIITKSTLQGEPMPMF
jgi:hypothetical protein